MLLVYQEYVLGKEKLLEVLNGGTMYCDKCIKKGNTNIHYKTIKERPCLSCKKKTRGRFSNICPSCQINKHCVVCGEKL